MPSLGSWMEVSFSFSNRVRKYSSPPWAPQSREHRIIQECYKANSVKTLPSSLNLGFW